MDHKKNHFIWSEDAIHISMYLHISTIDCITRHQCVSCYSLQS